MYDYQFLFIVLAYFFFVLTGRSNRNAISMSPMPHSPHIQSKPSLHNFIAQICVASNMMSSTTTTAWLADPSFARGITRVRNLVLDSINPSIVRRLVFRLFTQVRRTICTSVPLRTSTKVSPGFTLFKHSSPSFGSIRICSCSYGSQKFTDG